ncbi:ERF family protein [Streptococcus agalactiae]|uniref:ERF family protein n=1 Tax=Streptococcus agalactiae TaxID=1311 RepID=UPI00085C502E|nr:ERF family protein [Streptococcus agalactiae]
MAEIISFSELQKKMQIDKKGKEGIKFKYRNAEDIYNKFKKIDSDWELIASDDLFEICGRLFVKSTVTVQRLVNDILEKRDATAFSELDNVPVYKNGNQQMQIPQWTGAVGSYARKYALQGLFAIGEDDVDDLIPEVDGNQQQPQQNQNNVTQMPQQQNQIQYITPDLLNEFYRDLSAICDQKGQPVEAGLNWILGKLQLQSLEQLPLNGVSYAREWLTKLAQPKQQKQPGFNDL